MPDYTDFHPDGAGAGPLSYVARVRNFMDQVGQDLELIEWDQRIIPNKKLIFGGSEAAGAAAWHDDYDQFTLQNSLGHLRIRNEAPGKDLLLYTRNAGDTATYVGLMVKAGANVYPFGFFQWLCALAVGQPGTRGLRWDRFPLTGKQRDGVANRRIWQLDRQNQGFRRRGADLYPDS